MSDFLFFGHLKLEAFVLHVFKMPLKSDVSFNLFAGSLKAAKILEKAAWRDWFDLSMPGEQWLVLNV